MTSPEHENQQEQLRHKSAVETVPATNILHNIVATKAAHIESLKLRFGKTPKPQISNRSLYDALSQQPHYGSRSGAAFILECKKASPSKGVIRHNFDIEKIVKVYRHYASAISVLTDEQFFQGDMAYIAQVRNKVEQPILCKDFFISPYQIQLAAEQGADAILLMLSILSDLQYIELTKEAAKYQLDILTEISTWGELKRAIALGASIIGINNRNLRDLSTDLHTTEKLASLIPNNTLVISESGIHSYQDVRRLNPLVNGFLVGSSLMAQADLDLACRKLIFGEHKVCGLTRVEDVKIAAQSGAVYGGMIFSPESKRQINVNDASKIVSANANAEQKLKLVGVFVNESLPTIANIADDLELYAVQLHGQETEQDINELRQLLQNKTQIWKAVAVDVQSGKVADIPQNADRIIYDSQGKSGFGGSGETFDWHIHLEDKANAMLAGGLTPDNAAAAASAGFLGLDFNSGVESFPGIKDKTLIQQVFHHLRGC